MKEGRKAGNRIIVMAIVFIMLTLAPLMPTEAARTKISSCTVKLSKESYIYTGNLCKPQITVKYKGKKLKNKRDYTVTYKNNRNAGTAAVTIKGKANFTGTVTKKYKIKKKPITSGCSIKLSKTSYSYSGSACKPSATVTYRQKKLKKGVDFLLSYKNNVKVGTASVVIRGKGNYTGSVTKKYKIKKRSIASGCSIKLSKTSYSYSGSACKPSVTVTYKKKKLKEGADFSVTYKNNVEVGTASAVIKGKGNYTGSVTKEFTIEQQPHQHQYKEESRTEPTCKKQGEVVEVCSICREKRVTKLPLAAHTYPTGWSVAKEPTAHEAGLKVKKCTVCGVQLEEQEIPVIGITDPAEIGQEQVARGLEYGIIDTYYDRATITFEEYFAILEQAMRVSAKADGLADMDAEAMVSAWKERWKDVCSNKETMTRYDGMAGLFTAAEAMGNNYRDFTADYKPVYTDMEEPWDGCIWKESVFGDGSYQISLYDAYREEECTWEYRQAAYLYSFGRSSLVDNETVFDYDRNRKSMRPADNMTYAEAVTAAVRLYESVLREEVEGFRLVIDGASTVIAAKRINDDYYITTKDAKRLLNVELETADDTYVILYEVMEAAGLAYEQDMVMKAAYVWTLENVQGQELIAAAQKNAENVTSIHSLPKLAGFVLHDQEAEFSHGGGDIKRIANWGFSTVRLGFSYKLLFNEDGTQIREDNMKALDGMVEAAMKYRLHLNLTTAHLPGHWYGVNDNFTYEGDFDLFSDPKDQEAACRMWECLSERYKDVPNAYLSFTPIWEVTNKDLSTGLACEDYTAEQLADTTVLLVDAIRAKDGDRFIFYEAANEGIEAIQTSGKVVVKALEGYENVQASYNFCENAYVYAGMTATEGAHIDLMNHGMIKPGYPNTVYDTQSHIAQNKGITINGGVPGGTKINLYVKSTGAGGNFTIAGDGKILYTEKLEDKAYGTGEKLSLYYPYQTSEKLIEITVGKDVESLALSCDGGWVEWCGMDITLPSSYTQKKWYFPTMYDGGTREAFLKDTSSILLCPSHADKGNEIVLDKANLSYSTEAVQEEASLETIREKCGVIAENAPFALVRFESAEFGGTTQQAMTAYYEDVLSTFQENGLQWLSNDYEVVNGYINYAGGVIAGAETISYPPYTEFNLELLQLLQKYSQEKCTVGGTTYTTHKYQVVSSTPATCQSAGAVVKQCERCGVQKTVPCTKQLDHVLPKEWEVVDESTGLREKHCSLCGILLDSAYVVTDSSKIENEAVRRGFSYGILDAYFEKDTIRSEEYFALLEQAIRTCAQKDARSQEEIDAIIAAWKEKYANPISSSQILSRSDGMVGLLGAAEALDKEGDYWYCNKNFFGLNSQIGYLWDGFWHDELFGDAGGEEYSIGVEGETELHGPTLFFVLSYFYAMGRYSLVDGQTLFDYDEVSNSMRPTDNMTWEEAVVAIVRFYESKERVG